MKTSERAMSAETLTPGGCVVPGSHTAVASELREEEEGGRRGNAFPPPTERYTSPMVGRGGKPLRNQNRLHCLPMKHCNSHTDHSIHTVTQYCTNAQNETSQD